MAYHVRVICVSAAPTLDEVAAGAATVDGMALDGVSARSASADVMLGGETVAEVEINAGDDTFVGEFGELRELIAGRDGADTVGAVLDRATAIVAFRILQGTSGMQANFQSLLPLFEGLRAADGGLLQCDDDGFYAGNDLVLSLE